MAGLRKGEIQFDSPRNVFYSGQVLNGKVIFQVDSPCTLTAVYVNFLGEATVGWTEEESEMYNGDKRYKEVQYLGREQYFNITQLLAGGNAPQNLPPGTHTYQFSYTIPPGAPSSFRGDRGSVTYCAKATIELSGRASIKEEYPKFFDVVAPFDLNLGSPKLREPVAIEFEEVYSCSCFCSGDPVTIKIRLPVSGYCPGQIAPVAVQVENQSSVEVRQIIFQILTRQRYRTQRPVSEYIPPEEVITEVKKGSIMSNTKRNYTVEMKMPEIIAPNLEDCGIIDVGYFFRAIIKLSGCNDDLEDEAEICLGLLPLVETLEGEYVHPLAADLPIGPIPARSAIPVQEHAQLQEMHHSNTRVPFPNPETQGEYFVQVQQHYQSSDPSKNYQIGFTMTGTQSQMNTYPMQNWPVPPYPASKDLNINLPPINMNYTASAPPPSS